MSLLVRRVREYAEAAESRWFDHGENIDLQMHNDLTEAANRIEELEAAPGQGGVTEAVVDVEAVARAFHDEYEAWAAATGWETQERTRVAFDDLPPANRATMTATVRALLDRNIIALPHLAAPTQQLSEEERYPLYRLRDGEIEPVGHVLTSEEADRLIRLCEFEASGFDPEKGPTRDPLADKLRSLRSMADRGVSGGDEVIRVPPAQFIQRALSQPQEEEQGPRCGGCGGEKHSLGDVHLPGCTYERPSVSPGQHVESREDRYEAALREIARGAEFHRCAEKARDALNQKGNDQ